MDEVIRSSVHFQEHTGELTHKTTQPTEDIILARNAELRKNPGSIRDLGHGSEGGTFGRQLASIPVIMFERAIRDGYDLMNTDAKFAAKEMQRYLATTEGKMCMVQSPDKRIFTGN